MKVVYVEAARADLADVIAYVGRHHPGALARLRLHLRAAEVRIGLWPESAPRVERNQPVRMLVLRHYPYKIFYHIHNDTVELLRVRHAARLGHE